MSRSQGQGEGTVYLEKTGKHAGTWTAALTVGYRSNGRPRVLVRRRATETAARKALRELANDRDRGRIPTRPQDWKLADWLAHWLAEWQKAEDPADSTRHGYVGIIRNHINPAIGNTRMDRVSERHWRQVDEAMAAKGLSTSSRHQAYVVLAQSLNYAVREGVRGYSPLASTKPPTVRRKELTPPDKRDVAAILAAAEGDPDEARWLLALDVGLRQGEALGIGLDRIDLDKQVMVITHQLRRLRGIHDCGDPIPDPTDANPGRKAWPCGHRYASLCPTGTPGRLALVRLKTPKARRTVPISEELLPLIRAQMTRRTRDKAMLGKAYTGWRTPVDGRQRKVELLFAQPNGRPIEPHDDWEAWHALLARAGLGKHRLHDARHAAVVNMLDSGVPLHLASMLVGHANHGFTASVYGHLEADAAQAAVSLISAGRKRQRDELTERRKRDMG